MLSDVRKYPFIILFFVFFATTTVNSFFNSAALKSQSSLTLNIVSSHERFMANTRNGCQQQRILIPGIAEGMKNALQASPVATRLMQTVYGIGHGIPHLVIAYILVHIFGATIGLLGVYAFSRNVLRASILFSAFAALLFNTYETYALTGFVTGRWTDTSTPAFFIWCLYFLCRKEFWKFLATFAVFSLTREVSVFVLGFLFFTVVLSSDRKKEAVTQGLPFIAGFVAYVIIRGTLAKLYPGQQYCDHGINMWDGIKNSFAWNIHDSNVIKMPIFMHNILLVTSWLGWKKKPLAIKAIALTGVSMMVGHLVLIPAGEAYGRDLPVMLCFLISTVEWLSRKLRKAEGEMNHA